MLGNRNCSHLIGLKSSKRHHLCHQNPSYGHYWLLAGVMWRYAGSDRSMWTLQHRSVDVCSVLSAGRNDFSPLLVAQAVTSIINSGQRTMGTDVLPVAPQHRTLNEQIAPHFILYIFVYLFIIYSIDKYSEICSLHRTHQPNPSILLRSECSHCATPESQIQIFISPGQGHYSELCLIVEEETFADTGR